MSDLVRFHRAIKADLRAAAGWYDKQSRGLGQEFLRAFFATTAGLARHPELYSRVRGDFRRCLLPRFPYAIYYKIEEDGVVVYGV
ncbi:MAG: type II toxin-antitoxin system RelE/ParE family toxin [Candidatus Xenobia bacterium]